MNEQKIDLDYLVSELHSDKVLAQIKSFGFGSIMPRLRKEDLLSIKIELLKKPEQIAKVKGLKEEHIRGKEKELILEKEVLGLKDEAFREFASIKHTFRQYLNALKSNVSGTMKFISNNEGKNITLDTLFSKNLNRTLGEHLLSLEGTIDSLSKLLASPDEQIYLKPTLGEDFLKLILEAQDRFKKVGVFKFEPLYVDWLSFAQINEEPINYVSVHINPEDFYRIFSNIVSNAVEHGFLDEKKGYLMRTSLSYEPETRLCILTVSNNGKAISSSFTQRHLTIRGEKTTDSKGTGSGGADIKSIIEKYDGVFELIKDDDQEFPVTYVIKLPFGFFII